MPELDEWNLSDPFGLVNHGKVELRAFADGILATFPDLHIDLKSQFVAGSLAAMEWVMSGTHEGDMPGMPATHKNQPDFLLLSSSPVFCPIRNGGAQWMRLHAVSTRVYCPERGVGFAISFR